MAMNPIIPVYISLPYAVGMCLPFQSSPQPSPSQTWSLWLSLISVTESNTFARRRQCYVILVAM